MDKKAKKFSLAKRALAGLLFITAVVFCLFWGGRLVGQAADGQKEYIILNDEYSRVLEMENPAEGLTQGFDWPGGEPLYGMRLNVAAFERVNYGTAHLDLYTADGRLAAQAACDMTELLDNTFFGFVFDQPYQGEKEETLTLHFWYQPATGEDKLGLWASDTRQEGFAQSSRDATLAMQAMTGYTGGLVSKGYTCLAGLLLVMLAAGYAMVQKKQPVQRVFALCAALLGLGFALVLPPLCGPDEYVHGAGAYALATELTGQEAYREENLLNMRACDAEYMTDETGPSGAFVYADWMRQLGDGGQDPALTGTAEVRAPGSVVTYLYLPAALGVLLARSLGLSFYGMWLLGRLGGLAAYILLGQWALRRMPFGKTLLFVAMLMPSTLGLAACFSADTLIMGLAFAFTALCLDCAFGKKKVGRWDMAALAVLAALLGPGKAVYVLLVGLVFLIPTEAFGGPRKSWLGRGLVFAAAVAGWCFYNLEYIRYILRDVNELAVLGGVVLLAAGGMALPRLKKLWDGCPPARKKWLLAALALGLVLAVAVGLWALHLGGDLTPQQMLEGIQPNGDSIYTYSAGYSLRHLPAVAKLLVNSLVEKGPFVLQQMLGAWPGEPIIHGLQLNWLLTLGFFCLLVLASLKQAGQPARLDKKAIWLVGFVCLGVAGLVTAACLTWTPINYQVIFGLQGRYLLPVLPLLMLLLGENPWLALQKNGDKGLRLGALALSSLALVDTLYLFACL